MQRHLAPAKLPKSSRRRVPLRKHWQAAHVAQPNLTISAVEHRRRPAAAAAAAPEVAADSASGSGGGGGGAAAAASGGGEAAHAPEESSQSDHASPDGGREVSRSSGGRPGFCDEMETGRAGQGVRLRAARLVHWRLDGCEAA